VARRGDRAARTGTVLVLIGFSSILAVTFGTGFYAGRLTGPRPSGDLGATREARRGLGGGRLTDVASATDMPDLTFYQELTAPLAQTPPPPKPPRRPPPAPPPPAPAAATAASGPAPLPEVATPPSGPSVAVPALPERSPRTAPGEPSPRLRYTVQVGAYRARQPAEALRSTLTAAGHAAQVVEIDAPGGVRYRVRVGSFATREDAREAASKLTSVGVLSAFVTTR
jgi:cell division septation protein DedD